MVEHKDFENKYLEIVRVWSSSRNALHLKEIMFINTGDFAKVAISSKTPLDKVLTTGVRDKPYGTHPRQHVNISLFTRIANTGQVEFNTWKFMFRVNMYWGKFKNLAQVRELAVGLFV